MPSGHGALVHAGNAMPKSVHCVATALLAGVVLLAALLPQASAARACGANLGPLPALPRSLLQANGIASNASGNTTAPAAGAATSATSSTGAESGTGNSVGDGGPSVTVVKGAAALQEAVQRGDPHIEIQAHLDLTGLKPLTKGLLLGIVPPTVRSIRVRPAPFLSCCLTVLRLSSTPVSQTSRVLQHTSFSEALQCWQQLLCARLLNACGQYCGGRRPLTLMKRHAQTSRHECRGATASCLLVTYLSCILQATTHHH